MKKIELKAFGKINLTLDVCGRLDNGYHEVSMILQQILLCDDLLIRWRPDHRETGLIIKLSANKPYLPTDERNLAYKAAALMAEHAVHTGHTQRGTLRIDIKKRIPVAAGLAGGSADAAAVLHGLRKLWDLPLTLEDLCSLGARLGSDVPFCVMGQAAASEALQEDFKDHPLACHCALAEGTGTDLTPVPGLVSHLVISKPSISVSTAEVYSGIDDEEIPARPDNREMIDALRQNNRTIIKKNLVNVLENYTLKRYPIVMYTKDTLASLCSSEAVLMSGSGPSVFALCRNMGEARDICRQMLRENRESFWTRTTR